MSELRYGNGVNELGGAAGAVVPQSGEVSPESTGIGVGFAGGVTRADVAGPLASVVGEIDPGASHGASFEVAQNEESRPLEDFDGVPFAALSLEQRQDLAQQPIPKGASIAIPFAAHSPKLLEGLRQLSIEDFFIDIYEHEEAFGVNGDEGSVKLQKELLSDPRNAVFLLALAAFYAEFGGFRPDPASTDNHAAQLREWRAEAIYYAYEVFSEIGSGWQEEHDTNSFQFDVPWLIEDKPKFDYAYENLDEFEAKNRFAELVGGNDFFEDQRGINAPVASSLDFLETLLGSDFTKGGAVGGALGWLLHRKFGASPGGN